MQPERPEEALIIKTTVRCSRTRWPTGSCALAGMVGTRRIRQIKDNANRRMIPLRPRAGLGSPSRQKPAGEDQDGYEHQEGNEGLEFREADVGHDLPLSLLFRLLEHAI